MRAMHQQFTTALEGLTRRNAGLENELTQSRQQAGYAGAAIPRLQKLMEDGAKAAAPIPNATILDDDDRAASAQLYWIPCYWRETAKVSRLVES